MIRVDVDVDISKAMAKLDGMQARSRDLTPALIRARERLETYNAENFDSA